jgi:hypothetical protein
MRAFMKLTEAFTTVPVIAQLNTEKAIVFATDASSYISTGILSQYNNQGILQKIISSSKSYSSR